MTRHARNSTAGSVYTYHEKKKDAKESGLFLKSPKFNCFLFIVIFFIQGFGTERQRLAKDSVNSFDSCSLSLQLARNPVVSKQGYIFDKEAILQYIITKKNEYNRKMKEYERQKSDDTKELEEIAAAENKKKLDKFTKTEKNITSKSKRICVLQPLG
jgi:nitric oxide synthase-interacting protein